MTRVAKVGRVAPAAKVGRVATVGGNGKCSKGTVNIPCQSHFLPGKEPPLGLYLCLQV